MTKGSVLVQAAMPVSKLHMQHQRNSPHHNVVELTTHSGKITETFGLHSDPAVDAATLEQNKRCNIIHTTEQCHTAYWQKYTYLSLTAAETSPPLFLLFKLRNHCNHVLFFQLVHSQLLRVQQVNDEFVEHSTMKQMWEMLTAAL